MRKMHLSAMKNRRFIRKKNVSIMLIAVLSAGILITGCGNTNDNNVNSGNGNNAGTGYTASDIIGNGGVNGKTNNNGGSNAASGTTTVNHDYLVTLLSYDKNDNNYDEPSDFNREQDGRKYGRVEQVSYYSSSLGKMRDANVFLPKDYDTTKSYPVVYLMHGMGGNYMDYKNLDALNIAQNAVYDYNRNDMILVSFTVFTDKDGKSESEYNFSDLTTRYDACENDVINDLIPYINEHYATKQGREYTAVAGFSLGGREALYLCFAHPDVFGYVGAFAPVGGVVNTGSGERIYGNRGFLLPELVKDGGEAPLVTLIVTGDTDPYCKVSSEKYSEYMNNHNIENIFYYRTGGHEAVVWNNGLYNFLRRIF